MPVCRNGGYFFMEKLNHQIHQCLKPECRLRFPTLSSSTQPVKCPKCGSPARLIKTFPTIKESAQENALPHGFPPLEALLDNIRSAYNVGSIFRSADGAGVQHLYLCGVTPAPGDPKITKTALGAEFTIPWSLHWDSIEIARVLCEQGKRLWALETTAASQSLFELDNEPDNRPIVLVVGNEVSGIDPGIMQLCERSIHIPMLGTKNPSTWLWLWYRRLPAQIFSLQTERGYRQK